MALYVQTCWGKNQSFHVAALFKQISQMGYVCVIPVNSCELHCRPVNEHFSERMLDTVIDGTQCYEGSQSRDICINGICKVGNGFDLFAQSQTVHVNFCLSFSL